MKPLFSPRQCRLSRRRFARSYLRGSKVSGDVSGWSAMQRAEHMRAPPSRTIRAHMRTHAHMRTPCHDATLVPVLLAGEASM